MRVCSGVVPVVKPVPGVWMRVCVPAVLAAPCEPAPAGAPRPCAKATEETAKMLTNARESLIDDFMMDVLEVNE